MAILLRSIEHFNPQSEGIQEYAVRVDQYFEANGIVGEAKKDKRRSAFLTLVGPATYKLLRNLLEPGINSRRCSETIWCAGSTTR